jgi:hypothetical protein
LDILPVMPEEKFDAIIVAVAHNEFKDLRFNCEVVYRVKDV